MKYTEAEQERKGHAEGKMGRQAAVKAIQDPVGSQTLLLDESAENIM